MKNRTKTDKLIEIATMLSLSVLESWASTIGLFWKYLVGFCIAIAPMCALMVFFYLVSGGWTIGYIATGILFLCILASSFGRFLDKRSAKRDKERAERLLRIEEIKQCHKNARANHAGPAYVIHYEARIDDYKALYPEDYAEALAQMNSESSKPSSPPSVPPIHTALHGAIVSQRPPDFPRRSD